MFIALMMFHCFLPLWVPVLHSKTNSFPKSVCFSYHFASSSFVATPPVWHLLLSNMSIEPMRHIATLYMHSPQYPWTQWIDLYPVLCMTFYCTLHSITFRNTKKNRTGDHQRAQICQILHIFCMSAVCLLSLSIYWNLQENVQEKMLCLLIFANLLQSPGKCKRENQKKQKNIKSIQKKQKKKKEKNYVYPRPCAPHWSVFFVFCCCCFFFFPCVTYLLYLWFSHFAWMYHCLGSQSASVNILLFCPYLPCPFPLWRSRGTIWDC